LTILCSYVTHEKLVQTDRHIYIIIFNRAEVQCDLYINKKLEIATYAGKLLNSRTELILKCQKVNKYTLANHDTKD